MQESQLEQITSDARHAARVMAGLTPSARDRALKALRQQLENGRDVIEAANRADKDAAKAAGLDAVLSRRLDLEGAKFDDMLSKIDDVAAIADPVGGVQVAAQCQPAMPVQ